MKSLAVPIALVLSGSLAHALVFPITKQVKHASTTIQRRSGRASYSRPQVMAAEYSSSTDDDTDLR